MRPALLSILLLLPLSGCFATGPEIPVVEDDSEDAIHVVDEWTGFDKPLLVANAGDGSGRLFVVEQKGTIQAVHDNGTRTQFADLTDRVGSAGNEQGLLGLAFHPDFQTNGVVIVSYSGLDGSSVISRFTAMQNDLDPSSEEVLLQIEQPFSNHNGGHVIFGPDGNLYIGMGDGGSAGDPLGHGQNARTLLGTILRIQVAASGTYSIPSDNPFADGVEGAPEVWLYGIRNPWRFSFDDGGNLWIGDVGQNQWEEISRTSASDAGANLGWNVWEGTHQYPSGVEGDSAVSGMLPPVAEYSHDNGRCSITGGYVLGSDYFFADYCTGEIFSMPTAGGSSDIQIVGKVDGLVSSFGQGEAGELYIVNHQGSIVTLEAGISS